jgi:hypothetical protein
MTDTTPAFARNDPHDQRVPILLTADEYLFVRNAADDKGVSISAYVRTLINDDRRALAQKQLSASTSTENSAEPTHDMHKFIKTLAALVKAEL